VKKMAESMKNMDPEMLKSAAKAAGMDMPNIDPAQMAQAAEAMGKMSPEQMEKMMVWAQRGQKCLRYITALAGLAPPATAVCRDGGVWRGGGAVDYSQQSATDFLRVWTVPARTRSRPSRS
jgi:hypothetical protein